MFLMVWVTLRLNRASPFQTNLEVSINHSNSVSQEYSASANQNVIHDYESGLREREREREIAKNRGISRGTR
jgi:hypothetical protein